MTVDIDTAGLEGLADYFRSAPKRSEDAGVFAINDTAQFARRLSSTEIRKQVRFTRDYLAREDRLGVVRQASTGDLEAIVRGRDRPTSLASEQFTRSARTFGKRRTPVRVSVSRGSGAKPIPGAFFIRLRKGTAALDEASNVGLAIRLRPGDSVRGKKNAVTTRGGLTLLYGPSVGQVFRDVAQDVSPAVASHLVDQYVRQFERGR